MSQSRGHIINTRMALTTTQTGMSTIVEFFSRMKSLADDMASTRKKLKDEEIAYYILTGLDSDFSPIVFAMARAPSCCRLGSSTPN